MSCWQRGKEKFYSHSESQGHRDVLHDLSWKYKHSVFGHLFQSPFQQQEATDGPMSDHLPFCLNPFSMDRFLDSSILLLSFFIWVNSENWWLNCLLHVLWWLVFSLFLFCFLFLISLSHGHLATRRSKPSPRGPQSSRVFWPVSQFQVEVSSTHRTLVWTVTRQGLGLDTPGLETVKSLAVNVWFCPKHWMLKWLISRHKYLIIYSICQFPVKRLLFPVMVKGVAGVQEAGMPPGRSLR